MAATPPVCEFDASAIDFCLPDTTGKLWTLADCRGPKGLIVMFICNHCPYVKAILADLVMDLQILYNLGVHSVAIMSNDIIAYPEDAPRKMAELAESYHFSFPYLYDEQQVVARDYGAVCTPDFFGYNEALQLQYRGCFDSRQKSLLPEPGAKHDLLEAMTRVAQTGQGPREQVASVGCSIKWRG